MCGILGVIEKDIRTYSKEIFEKALDAQKFRGPDNSGVAEIENGFIGHVRLSIIDESGGGQPLIINDHIITFNGEIYNYKSLRKWIMDSGVTFNSKSDTEVLLRGYLLHGDSFFQQINGMFSFAIYDIKKRKLLIFRDHTGQKPLFFFNDHNKFVFSSNLNSLKTLIKDLKLNSLAIDAFLHLSYIPSPLSIFENVQKVKPGDLLEYDFNENLLNSKTIDHQRSNRDIDIIDLIKETSVSDFPIGISLSGGVDSSLIMSVLRKDISKAYNVFSESFHTKKLKNESVIAERFAKECDVSFLRKRFDELSIGELDEHLNCFDEPYADSSSLMARQVAVTAKNDRIKVVLTGDGADEMFGGYQKYLAFKWLKIFNKIPIYFRRIIALCFKNVKLKSIMMNSSNDKELYWHLCNMGINTYDFPGVTKLSQSELMDSIIHQKKNFNINDVLNTDRKLVLEGDMMVKSDRVYMYQGIESRPVFSSPSFLNEAKKYHAGRHINFFSKKRLLKKISRKILPNYILKKKKTGFDAPLSKIPVGEMKQSIIDNISNSSLNIYKKEVNLSALGIYASNLNLKIHKDCRDIYIIYSLIYWLKFNLDYFENIN